MSISHSIIIWVKEPDAMILVENLQILYPWTLKPVFTFNSGFFDDLNKMGISEFYLDMYSYKSNISRMKS